MKILFVSAQSSFNSQLKKALLILGHQVDTFDERANFLLPSSLQHSQHIWSMIKKVSWLKRLVNNAFNKRLVIQARESRPDILLTTKGAIIRPNTLAALRALGITCVNWFPENVYHPTYRDWFSKHCQSYDYFFSFDPTVREHFPTYKNLFYLPLAVDPDFYDAGMLSPAEKERYNCDVCFVGARYPEREELLMTVRNMGIRLKIFGWKDWLHSSLREYYYGPLNISEMAKAFSCARISLNRNLLPQNDGANLRTFEIPAACGFQLSDHQRDVPRLFTVGKEIEVYVDKKDLIEKIRFYMGAPEARQEIIENGNSRIKRDHSISHRVKELITSITSS